MSRAPARLLPLLLLGFGLFLSALIGSPKVHAQSPANALPTPGALSRQLDDLNMSPADFARRVDQGQLVARTCTVEAAGMRCTCIEGRIGNARVAIDMWDASTRVLTGVRMKDAGRAVALREHRLAPDGTHHVLGMTVLADGKPGWTAARGSVREDDGHFEELGFGLTPALEDLPLACGAEWPPLELRASASQMQWRAQQWHLEDFREGHVALGAVSTAAKGASGFLPPVVRAYPDAVSLTVAGYLQPLSLAPVASASPGRFYGGGLALVSEDGARLRWLETQLRWHPATGDVMPFAMGDAHVGTSRFHASALVEHPADQHEYNLRRTERGALFRDWRSSRFGLGLIGDAHDLQLNGAIRTNLEGTGEALDGVARYATRAQLVGPVHGEVDVWHHSLLVDEDVTHSTTTAVALAAPFGKRRRARIEPRLVPVANFGVASDDPGLDASTTAMVFGELDASLAWQGRFENAVHDVAPRLRLGREIVGVQQRAPRPDDALPHAFERPVNWTYGALILEQTVTSSGWHFDFPLGVFVSATDALERLDEPGMFARLAMRAARGGLELGAVRRPQHELAFLATSHLVLARRWTASYAFSRARSDDLRWLFLERALESPNQTVFLTQPAAFDEADEIAHHAMLRWRGERLAAELSGRLATPAHSGVAAGISWAPGRVGWSLAAQAGWIPASSDFNVIGGLALTPRP